MTVSVNLVSYASITSSLVSFTIEIIGCIVTAFTMINLSPTNDQTYVISDPTHTWNLVGSTTTTQVPACGYSEVLSSGLHPAFVTSTDGSTIHYSAFSRDLAFVGANVITVTSTLIGYDFDDLRPAPTCSSMF